MLTLLLWLIMQYPSFKKLQTNRRDLFESIDKPAMKPLPTHPFEYSECGKDGRKVKRVAE